jgi:hypothetical protein
LSMANTSLPAIRTDPQRAIIIVFRHRGLRRSVPQR